MLSTNMLRNLSPPPPSPSAHPPSHTHTLKKNKSLKIKTIWFSQGQNWNKVRCRSTELKMLACSPTAQSSGMGLGCSTVSKFPKNWSAWLSAQGCLSDFRSWPVAKRCSSLMSETGAVSSLPILPQFYPEGETQGLRHCPFTLLQSPPCYVGDECGQNSGLAHM